MVFGRSLTEARLISSANYVRTELPTRYGDRYYLLNVAPDKLADWPIEFETCKHFHTL